MLPGFNLPTSVGLPVDRLPSSLGSMVLLALNLFSLPYAEVPAVSLLSPASSESPLTVPSHQPLSVCVSLASSFGSLHVGACCGSSLCELYPLPFLSDSRLTFII